MKTFDLIFQRTMQIILLAIFAICMMAAVTKYPHQIWVAIVVFIMLCAVSIKEKEVKK